MRESARFGKLVIRGGGLLRRRDLCAGEPRWSRTRLFAHYLWKYRTYTQTRHSRTRLIFSRLAIQVEGVLPSKQFLQFAFSKFHLRQASHAPAS